MKAEDAIGSMVMVSPVLWTSDYAGITGAIEFADFINDKIWVRFDDDELDCFSSKTLFILKTCEELKQLAEAHRYVQWPPVFQNLLALVDLQASGSPKQLKIAFALVQNDPEIHRVATIRLNEATDFAPARKIGR